MKLDYLNTKLVWPLRSLVENISAGQPWWLTQMSGDGLEAKADRVSRKEPT